MFKYQPSDPLTNRNFLINLIFSDLIIQISCVALLYRRIETPCTLTARTPSVVKGKSFEVLFAIEIYTSHSTTIYSIAVI
jgi:hypothetical protein